MKNIVLLVCLVTFKFVFSQNKFERKAIVIQENISVYEKPDYSSSLLYQFKKNDTLTVVDYYQGSPYKKVLFWVVLKNGKKGYTTSKNLSFSDGGSIPVVYVYNLKNSEFHEKSDIEINEFEKSRITINKKLESKKRDSLDYVQNCHYEINEFDSFDKVKKIKTKYYSLEDASFFTVDFRVKLIKIGLKKYLAFEHFNDLGCTSSNKNNRSFVKFMLENDEIITFYHNDNVDCGSFYLIANLTKQDEFKLKKSKIKKVRLSGTENYMDIEKIFFKDFFYKKLKCIE